MGKKFIFNIVLNLIIILTVVVGSYFFKHQNYLMPIVCLAAFGLTIFYKLKLIKQIKLDIKAKASENTKLLSKK
jgi:peptidoglycan biosynthesis protein MviN/MurJ (putative lipid II flippase)